MKLIKGAIFVFVGLFVMVTLISLLIPSRIVTARAVTVQADSTKLFNEISDLKNWKNWHPVFKADSTALSFSPITNQVNSTAEWTQNSKTYKVVIVEKKYPLVKINLQREGEKDIENILTLMPVQEQGNMQVQWQAVVHLRWYPWEKFGGIFIEKMAGQGYEDALQSLKKYVEPNDK
jgi:Polyketide cyclase / dehydrase and lipid transport